MAAATILIVADSRPDRLRLERIAAGAGYQLMQSCTGAEALEQTMAQQPAIVLLDVAADHMDGFRICRELSTNAATRHAAVLVVSDAHQDVDRLWAEQQGATGLITKPYSAEQVLEQLRRLD